MAVANTKSTIVNNADRSFVSGLPNIQSPRQLNGGAKRSKVGLCACLAADSNNSVYRFARVSSRALLSSVKFVNDAMAGFTAADVGVYDTAQNGGAVVSQHLFATGLDIHLASTGTETRWTNLAAATVEQQLWQLLALAADPGKDYDIAITGTTRGGAAGNIAMLVEEVTES